MLKLVIMKKFILSVIFSFLIIGLLVSCSKNLDISDDIKHPTKYNVSILAKKSSTKVVADGGKASFSTSEKVWVYNESTGKTDRNYLTPAGNAVTTTLVGELSGTYSVNDQIKLLYNSGMRSGVIDYNGQNGKIQNVKDAGVASVSIKEVEDASVKTTDAVFTNLQSIFKLKFVDGSTTLRVKSVSITSVGNKLQQSYDIISNTTTYGSITVSDYNAMTDVFVALRFSPNPSDIIIFNVIDENGKVYTGTKKAPELGFTIGKFYSSTIQVTSHLFSISSSESVYFSPGNLTADYSFKIPQYSYSYNADDEATLSWIQGSIIHDGFSNSGNTNYVNCVSGWYVLSKQEWEYLLFERQIDGGAVSPYYMITTDSNNGGTFGMLIPHDDAKIDDVVSLTGDGLNNVDLSVYTAKGFVFLPAAGAASYESGIVASGEIGMYWSRTNDEGDDSSLYSLEFEAIYLDVGPTKYLVDVEILANIETDYYTTRLVHK